jgi:hypothetical protein
MLVALAKLLLIRGRENSQTGKCRQFAQNSLPTHHATHLLPRADREPGRTPRARTHMSRALEISCTVLMDRRKENRPTIT